MKPRLFPSGASSYNTMGYGEISAVSCVVSEELNGEYALDMLMLNTDPMFKRMQVGSIIAAKPNQTDPIQAFCIEQINKPINGEVQIYATHIAQFRGKLIPVKNFSATSLDDAISKALSNSLETNPFKLSTDKTTATAYRINAPRSFRELLGGAEGSILDLYGGEYKYDNFTIELLNHRGRDNGVRIFYGKNMVDFLAEDQFDWDDSPTGVVPYWLSEENGTLVVGDAQYSSNSGLYPYNRTIIRDFTEDYEMAPTKSQLESDAAQWIKNRGLPVATISVSFDELVTNNRGKLIALGDTVHVINSVYDVNYSSRIVKTEYNVLLERYDNIEVGKKKTNINEAIAEASGSYATGDFVIVSSGSFSSLPQTINDSRIKASHIVVSSVLSNPAAQRDAWTVTTANGSLTISGTILDSTSVTLYLK